MFNKQVFVSICKDRGYMKRRDMDIIIGGLIGTSPHVAAMRINKGQFSIEDAEIIASWFEMTPREFCDCFFHGLFYETPSGSFRAVPHHAKPRPKEEPEEQETKRKSQSELGYEAIKSRF